MFVVHMILGMIGGTAGAAGAVYADAPVWAAVATYVATGNFVFIGSLALAMLLYSGAADEAQSVTAEPNFAGAGQHLAAPERSGSGATWTSRLSGSW